MSASIQRIETKSELVFVYGSNLNLVHLDSWCADNGYGRGLFKRAGDALMPDTALAFNLRSRRRGGGVLNLRFQRGNMLRGYLLKPSEAGWRALDHKEGVGSGAYKRIVRNVFDWSGNVTPVVTYAGFPAAEGRHYEPAPGYVDTVLAGYDEFEWIHRPVLDAAAGKVSPSNEDALFVYGTLLRGEERAHLVSQHKPSCVLLAETSGLLADIGAYPALLPRHQSGDSPMHVQGEFVRFDDIETVLEQLDAIEAAKPFGEAGGLYRRAFVPVGVGDGRVRYAWTYVMDDHQVVSRPIISSGCWRHHHNRLETAVGSIVAAHAARRPDFFKALDTEARHFMAPEIPPPFDVTLDGATKALMAGDLSERTLARSSGDWAVTELRRTRGENGNQRRELRLRRGAARRAAD